MEWEERFSKAHPLKIRDNDVFLHGTSLEKYLDIQLTGLLKREVPQRNWSISQAGVCFEKYKHGKYCGADAKRLIDITIEGYCNATCRSDQSKEGVVLQIKGKELKKLGCPIYVDWNKHIPRIYDAERVPIDVDSDSPVLSIIVIDRDIPLEYLEVVRRVPFKE